MYKVIIADDEVIERTVLGKKIKKNFGDSISLRQARNGREVVSFYKEESADILILDIEMPGVTGLEAAEQIRAMGAACGIIFLTAFDEFSYAKRAISVRALDYLLKPCDDRELIAAVEEGMRGADERHRRAAEAATRMAMQTGAAASAGEVQTGTGIAGGQGFVNRQVMVNGQIVAGQMSTGRLIVKCPRIFQSPGCPQQPPGCPQQAPRSRRRMKTAQTPALHAASAASRRESGRSSAATI